MCFYIYKYHRLISICIKNFDSGFSYCISAILDIISNEYLFDGYCRELFGQHIDSLNANSYGESCIWNASGEKCDLIYWRWLLFFQDMENCIRKYKLMRNIFLFCSCHFGFLQIEIGLFIELATWLVISTCLNTWKKNSNVFRFIWICNQSYSKFGRTHFWSERIHSPSNW